MRCEQKWRMVLGVARVGWSEPKFSLVRFHVGHHVGQMVNMMADMMADMKS